MLQKLFRKILDIYSISPPVHKNTMSKSSEELRKCILAMRYFRMLHVYDSATQGFEIYATEACVFISA